MQTSVLVLAVIDRVSRELGTTTVVITHNAAIAAITDRVIHLSNGLIAHIDHNARRQVPEEIVW